MGARAQSSLRIRDHVNAEKTYFCCQCSYGPMLVDLYPACIECHERYCNLCTTDYTFSSKRTQPWKKQPSLANKLGVNIRQALPGNLDSRSTNPRQLTAASTSPRNQEVPNSDSGPGGSGHRKAHHEKQSTGDGVEKGTRRGSSVEKPGPSVKRKKKATRNDDLKLPCPYYLHDPQQYHEKKSCRTGEWSETRRLQLDHLSKYHRKKYKCLDCGTDFKTMDEIRGHGYNSMHCSAEHFEPSLEMDEHQEENIRKVQRQMPNTTEVQKWYRFVEILLPEYHRQIVGNPYCRAPPSSIPGMRTTLSYWDAVISVVEVNLPAQMRQALAADAGHPPGPGIEQALSICDNLWNNLTQSLLDRPSLRSNEHREIQTVSERGNENLNIQEFNPLAIQNHSALPDSQMSMWEDIPQMSSVIESAYPALDSLKAESIHNPATVLDMMSGEPQEPERLWPEQTSPVMPFSSEALPTYGTDLQLDFSDLHQSLLGENIFSDDSHVFPQQ